MRPKSEYVTIGRATLEIISSQLFVIHDALTTVESEDAYQRKFGVTPLEHMRQYAIVLQNAAQKLHPLEIPRE